LEHRRGEHHPGADGRYHRPCYFDTFTPNFQRFDLTIGEKSARTGNELNLENPVYTVTIASLNLMGRKGGCRWWSLSSKTERNHFLFEIRAIYVFYLGKSPADFVGAPLSKGLTR